MILNECLCEWLTLSIKLLFTWEKHRISKLSPSSNSIAIEPSKLQPDILVVQPANAAYSLLFLNKNKVEDVSVLVQNNWTCTR